MSTYLDLLEGNTDPLLEKICQEHGLKPETVERLKAEEEGVAHLKNRNSIFHKIDEILDSVPSQAR